MMSPAARADGINATGPHEWRANSFVLLRAYVSTSAAARSGLSATSSPCRTLTAGHTRRDVQYVRYVRPSSLPCQSQSKQARGAPARDNKELLSPTPKAERAQIYPASHQPAIEA